MRAGPDWLGEAGEQPGGRGGGGDEKVVAGAGAGRVEETAFALVSILDV